MKAYKGYIRRRGPHSFQANLWHPGRVRETATFSTKALAINWLMSKSIIGESLSFDQMQDAIAALKKLPANVSLSQAADHYLATSSRPTSEHDVKLLLDIYLGERSGLRARTVEGYRQDLNRILSISTDLAQWTRSNIMLWVAPLTPSKRNHVIASLRAFLQWCTDSGHLSQNPLAGVKSEKTDAPKRKVLTISDASKLLQTAHAQFPHLLHYVAICLFAGVRPDECKRLTREHIANGYIYIDETIAKTHSARTIPMHQNLEDFINGSPLPPSGVCGGLSPERFRKHLTALIKASGVEWSNDVMRHSYASYEYERSKDAGATAANLGHTNTTMLFKHYRGLVAPGTGDEFFKIKI